MVFRSGPDRSSGRALGSRFAWPPRDYARREPVPDRLSIAFTSRFTFINPRRVSKIPVPSFTAATLKFPSHMPRMKAEIMASAAQILANQKNAGPLYRPAHRRRQNGFRPECNPPRPVQRLHRPRPRRPSRIRPSHPGPSRLLRSARCRPKHSWSTRWPKRSGCSPGAAAPDRRPQPVGRNQ